MALTNMMNQIEEIDLSKGYGNYETNNLADGNYEGYCEDLVYIDKEEGGLFIIKLKTVDQEPYAYFLNVNPKQKFNLKNLVISLCYISNKMNENLLQMQIEATSNTENFVEKWKDIIVGKNLSFTLKTNKNNFQTCTIDKPEAYPF